MTTSTQIPIWVCGKRLWISGVDRKTTVNDVMDTLLGPTNKRYIVVEKWRQVERPLNGDTKILRLWNAWGDIQNEVKLSLREEPTDYISIGNKNATLITKRKPRYKWSRYKYEYNRNRTTSEKTYPQLWSENHGIEQLLKVIFSQGKTIQTRISRMKEYHPEIEELEEDSPNHSSIARNYLLDTYLGTSSEEKEQDDSGVVTEGVLSSENSSVPASGNFQNNEISIEIDELRDKIDLLQRIVKINKRLEKKEEHLVRLFMDIQHCTNNDHLVNTLQCDLNKTKNEMQNGEIEIKNNYKMLKNLENMLKLRKLYLKELYRDLDGNENASRDKTKMNISTNFIPSNAINEKNSMVDEYTTKSSYASALPYFVSQKLVLNTLV